MPRRFLTDAARAALREAVETVEAASAAEVVVSVRGSSASYLAVDLAVGAAAAVATLAFALFSPFAVALPLILIEPVVAGALVAFLASRVPALHRLLVPRAVLDRWVRRAARATFVERGVQHTAAHTGVLVYAALTERRVVLVADGGVERAVPPDELARAELALTAALAGGGDGTRLAAAIARLAGPLGQFLPRAAGDLNELGDEVD